MTIKVKMYPHLSHFRSEVSGIATVVKQYFRLLPQFDIELVEPDVDSYDLVVAHAGWTGPDCDVCMLHGMYWSADYNAPAWEYEVNSRIVEAIRHAKITTVPSNWVAETIRRELRFNPEIVGHGIDWDEWQHKQKSDGYVLAYGKNRINVDVCNPGFISYLARQFPHITFVCTFAPKNVPSNVEVIGTLPHEKFKRVVQKAEVVISPIKETWGILTAESAAAGKPILGVKAGGNLDLTIHGDSGYLYETDNLEDMAQGLDYCLKHKKVLGENGRNFIKQFTWESVCQNLARICEMATAEDIRPFTIDPSLYQVSDGI